MPNAPLKTVTLDCGSDEDAWVVARNSDCPTDPGRRVRQDGSTVVITYRMARFAHYVADYAWSAGRASDRAVADAIAALDGRGSADA